MIHNDKTPDLSVNPENHEVKIDGVKVSSEPAKELALAQRYFLF
jgi:urease subunit alpha